LAGVTNTLSANPNESSGKDGYRHYRGSLFLHAGLNSDLHFSGFTCEKITRKLCAQLKEMLPPYKNLEIRESEPFLYTIFGVEWGLFTRMCKFASLAASISKLSNADLPQLWLFERKLLNQIGSGWPSNEAFKVGNRTCLFSCFALISSGAFRPNAIKNLRVDAVGSVVHQGNRCEMVEVRRNLILQYGLALVFVSLRAGVLALFVAIYRPCVRHIIPCGDNAFSFFRRLRARD